MRFRPCIDIHNGKVKQIVGGSLRDEGSRAENNFVSEKDAAWYASLYKERKLTGGHIILLNPASSEYYEQDLKQAEGALAAWPGGMMIGGGVNAGNALSFLRMGASHVIVTSWIFHDGVIDLDRLREISSITGKDHLVLDLSCRRQQNRYLVVTDRWQTFTSQPVTEDLLKSLAPYCSEFLIHAVDAEGKAAGIEQPLAQPLGSIDTLPVTYAGGIGSFEDLRILKKLGKGRLDFTIGSALDLFGGNIPFEEAASFS